MYDIPQQLQSTVKRSLHGFFADPLAGGSSNQGCGLFHQVFYFDTLPILHGGVGKRIQNSVAHHPDNTFRGVYVRVLFKFIR
ncbi:MAG: hypothetical protein ACLU6O_18515 [Bilophila wadsworthia]